MTTKLRFAPLIRVSTEGQERRGESLRTQKKQVQEYVEVLHGVIPAHCWKYCGQEHATAGHDRLILDQLIADSGKKLFDAVIVCDASRWSRDNAKSKEGLATLRKHGVRFFVGSAEYDLFSPEQSLFLSLAVEIGEFHARMQNLKSTINRLNRAKRGIPTGGKIPYGRTYDSKTEKWGLDEEKVTGIRWAAEQYLAGKGLVKIAKELGVNPANLWKVLTKRSGTNWSVDFDCPNLNIKESVSIKVPPLLPEGTIKAVLARAASNKTYTHGESKHPYLLGRMVHCAECGYAMFGQTNHNGLRYYRHARHREKPCTQFKSVPAPLIEEAVLIHLFKTFGDVDAIKQAIQKAVPNQERVEKLRQQQVVTDKRLRAAQQEKQRLVAAISKGILSDKDASEAMARLREREELLAGEAAMLDAQLVHVPNRKLIAENAALVHNVIKHVFKQPHHLLEMSYERKKELVQHAFDGKDTQGNRLGVYVKRNGDGWQFTINGLLDQVVGHLPLSDEERRRLWPIDDDVAKYALH